MGKKSGVSLIIAIIYTSVLMLVVAGLVEAQLKSMRMRRDWQVSDHTYDLVESAEEIAGFWAAKYGAGWNSADITSPAEREKMFSLLNQTARELGFSECTADKPCAGFEVIGRPDANDPKEKLAALNGFWFSVPRKATGSASPSTSSWQAPKCLVDENHQNFPDDFANDPCNWNKLKIGESVDIPLYYEDAMGVHKVNGQFKLRIRTPLCDDIQPKSIPREFYCDFNGRVILYPQVALLRSTTYPFRNVDKDPVLVQWLISDKNGTSSLVANDVVEKLPSATFRQLDIRKLYEQNTEISAGRINDAKPNTSPIIDANTDNFVVLESTFFPGMDYRGKDIDKNLPEINEFLKNTSKPVLHLNLVSRPKVDNDNNAGTPLPPDAINSSDFDVPYLEYQLLTQDLTADSKTVIRGWAELGDFRKTFKKEITRPSSGGGFALENF